MATSTVNRIVMSAKIKYVLDNVDGCVLGFSLYKLTNKYNGYCIQVQRQSDNITLNIGFNYALKNPFVDISTIESFCAGTNGRIKIWYNQYHDNNAIQSVFNNMPIICTNGVFEINGIKFVAAENTKFICPNYAAIDIVNSPLSLYLNFKFTTKSNANIFSKSSGQYSIYYANPSLLRTYIAGAVRVDIASASDDFKILSNWQNTGINGVKARHAAIEAVGTCNAVPTAAPDVSIGGTTGNYLAGYISTCLIFNTSQYNNYNLISGGC